MTSADPSVAETTGPPPAAGPRAPGPVPGERRRVRRGTVLEVVAYALAAVGAAVAGAWSQRLWLADLSVPFSYAGDAVAVSAHVKTVIETGWYESQPLLGAPAGQTYHDFPAADNLHLLIARLIGPLTGGDWAATLNVYFLLGFPLAALAAMVFLRAVGVGRIMSAVGSVLFAMLPYHVMRGESHLFLASYYPVPLALLLVLRVVRGQPLWTLRRGSVRSLATSPAVATVAVGALVASASSYYAVFTLALLGVSGVAALVHRRSWRRFVGAAAYGVVIVVVMIANMLPDMLWARTHGSDTGAFVRNPADAEYYALKISSLVLPVPGHVVGALARLRAHYDADYPLPSEQPALGLVAAAGLVALLVVVVLRLLRPATSRFAETPRLRTLAALGGLVVVALLFATVGGVSSLISLVTPEIRGWNRMSVFIALLCLAAVGLLVDALRDAVGRRAGARPAAVGAVVLAGVLVVGGVLDQVAPTSRPDHGATRATFDSDARFVADLEERLGSDAMIAQLPFMPFPESPPVNGVLDTDQLRFYLHSDTLRWSAGGIKGRASADWLRALDGGDPATTATELAAAGFDGVTLDRTALGAEADALGEAWAAELGSPVATSPDGRYEAFDLTPLRRDLEATYGSDEVEAAGEAVVEPTFVAPDQADSGTLADDGTWTLSSAGGVVGVELDNARDEEALVRVTMSVSAASPVEVAWPDGSTTTERGATVSREVLVPPGRSTVTVTTRDGGALTVAGTTATVADRPVLEPAAP